jgi:hypothetical protein
MRSDGWDEHTVLTHLTSVLLGLELLERRTPLSPRQRLLVAHTLRSARALRALLVARAGERTERGEGEE